MFDLNINQFRVKILRLSRAFCENFNFKNYDDDHRIFSFMAHVKRTVIIVQCVEYGTEILDNRIIHNEIRCRRNTTAQLYTYLAFELKNGKYPLII